MGFVCFVGCLINSAANHFFWRRFAITKAYENTIVLCTKHSHPAFTNSQNVERFASFIMLPFQYRQLAADLNSNGIKESTINMPILYVGTDMTHLEEKSLLCSGD